MKRIALILLLAGCPKSSSNAPDAAVVAVAQPVAVAGGSGAFVLTPEMLDGYLRYTRAFAAGDGGFAVNRAGREDAALKASGLTTNQVARIDEIVSAVVARRLVMGIAGDQNLPDIEAMGVALNDEQKKQMELALAAAKKQQQAARDMVEERKQHGSRNIDVVLSREQDVIKAWTEMMGIGGMQLPVMPAVPPVQPVAPAPALPR